MLWYNLKRNKMKKQNWMQTYISLQHPSLLHLYSLKYMIKAIVALICPLNYHRKGKRRIGMMMRKQILWQCCTDTFELRTGGKQSPSALLFPLVCLKMWRVFTYHNQQLSFVHAHTYPIVVKYTQLGNTLDTYKHITHLKEKTKTAPYLPEQFPVQAFIQ